jgi:hypothetical protein
MVVTTPVRDNNKRGKVDCLPNEDLQVWRSAVLYNFMDVVSPILLSSLHQETKLLTGRSPTHAKFAFY